MQQNTSYSGSQARRRITSRIGLILALILAASASAERDTPLLPLQLPREDPPAVAADAEIEDSFRAETDRPPANRETGADTFAFAQREQSYTLDFLAAVDFVGEWDKETVHTTRNQFALREAELGAFASIDQLAEGTLIIAAHNEGGAYVAEIHEAFFFFPVTPLRRTSLKLGKFFFDTGRLNSIHRHDWPFTNAPLVHKELLDEEAVDQSGGEASFLFPWDFFQQLTVGVFNGKTFGHSHTEGPIKQNPLVNARLKQFFPLTENLGWQFGFSGLRYNPETNSHKHTEMYGADSVVKWQLSPGFSVQWWAEVWYRETRQKNKRLFDTPAPPVETRVGGYSFVELQFFEHWSVGLRTDVFTDPNKRGQLGYTIRNGTDQESLQITWKPSEFSFFRITGSRTTNRETGRRSYEYYLQADFILGRHPAHTY